MYELYRNKQLRVCYRERAIFAEKAMHLTFEVIFARLSLKQSE